MTVRVEMLEHTADVGFRARGRTLDEALDAAVRGLALVELGEPLPEPSSERSVELHAEDDESLVVSLLEECLYLVDAQGWVAVGATVRRREGAEWGAVFRGTELPEQAVLHVKAVTWHGLSVQRGSDEAVITVYLDI